LQFAFLLIKFALQKYLIKDYSLILQVNKITLVKELLSMNYVTGPQLRAKDSTIAIAWVYRLVIPTKNFRYTFKKLYLIVYQGMFRSCNSFHWKFFARVCVCVFREKAMAPHSSTLAWKIPWTVCLCFDWLSILNTQNGIIYSWVISFDHKTHCLGYIYIESV